MMAMEGGSDARDSGFIRGNLCMFVATVMFGVNIPVLKMLIPDSVSALGMTLLRLGGAALLFWATSLFMRSRSRISRNDVWRVVLGGMVGLFLFIYLFNVSLSYTTPIDVSIIMTLPPVFVALIGALFMHRRLSVTAIVGLCVSMAAAVLIIVSQGVSTDVTGTAHRHVIGDLIAICSALCYSFYLVIMEGPSRRYDTVHLMRWVFLMATIPSLFFIGTVADSALVGAPTLKVWLLVAFVVIGPSYIAYLLLQPAIKLVGSEIVSIYQYLVPVVAMLASVLMGVEHIKWYQPVAIVVILAGMWMTMRGRRQSDEAVVPKQSGGC